MIFNNSYSGHFSPLYSQSKARDTFSTHFHLQYTLMAAVWKNGCNLGRLLENGCNLGMWPYGLMAVISARCRFIVLIESSDDFEQLLFQAFFLLSVN